MKTDPRQGRLLEQLVGLRMRVRPGTSDEVLENMIRLAESDGPALSRSHFDPGHFTASAIVVCPERRRMLLIRHEKLGMWLQPGGHIEPTDENLLAAAERELREETGLSNARLLDPLFDLDVHQIPPFGAAPAHYHHDVRVLFEADAQRTDIGIVAGDDALDARWFSLETVLGEPGILASGAGTDESVRRVARRLLEAG